MIVGSVNNSFARPCGTKQAAPSTPARWLAHSGRGCREARLLGQDPQRSCGGGCAQVRHHRPRHQTPAQDVHRRRSQRIHRNPDPRGLPRVRLDGPALAVLAIRLPDPRSSLLRLDEVHDPARSGKGRAAEREKAKRQVAQTAAAQTSLRLDDVAGRYWHEVGQHHAGADNTERQLGYLIEFFGKDKLITDITDDDVAKLVAWRRGHRVRKAGTLISPFTVNDTTEQLQKAVHPRQAVGRPLRARAAVARALAGRAAGAGARASRRRRRAARSGDARRLCAVLCLRPRLGLAARGVLAEVVARSIGARGRSASPARAASWSRCRSRPTIREILWPLRGHHPEFVFTYVARTHPRRAGAGRALSPHLLRRARSHGGGCASGPA